jgi:hypothetical protein
MTYTRQSKALAVNISGFRPERAQQLSPGQAQRRPGERAIARRSALKGRHTVSAQLLSSLFRPFRACNTNRRSIPRAALRLPWAEILGPFRANALTRCV